MFYSNNKEECFQEQTEYYHSFPKRFFIIYFQFCKPGLRDQGVNVENPVLIIWSITGEDVIIFSNTFRTVFL